MAECLVVAHRGSPDAALGIRENTLDAFRRAAALGADGVELDVRRTADGALAVHHDPEVDGAGPVHELAAADLPAWVPLLADALVACAGLEVNVEIKNLPGDPGYDPTDALVDDVVGALRTAGRSGDVVVSSFWPATLDRVRALAPDLRTGLLVGPWLAPAAAVEEAVARRCTALHPARALVDRDLVAAAHAAGLTVAAWTVTGADDVVAAAAAGVDAVITDDVASARRALAGPG